MPTRQELPEKVWRRLALGCCNGVVGRGNSCDLSFAGREKPEEEWDFGVVGEISQEAFLGLDLLWGIGTVLFFQDL